MKNKFPVMSPRILSLLLIIIALLTIISCKSETVKKTESGSGDLAGYELENIPNSPIQHAAKKDANGMPVSEGYVSNGKRTGQWVEYTPDGEINILENYVEGLREGLALKFATRGQIENRAIYHQGILDGLWYQYKFGKIIEERTYKMGKLEGTIKTYDEHTFKLKQEVQYKDGKQDGYFRYYDAEGYVTLEYQYKNGEKVSGGIVEKKQ